MTTNGIFNDLVASIGNIGFFRQVREINRRYSKPKIKMTPMVRAALLFLQFYLLFLVLLLGYKFYTLVR